MKFFTKSLLVTPRISRKPKAINKTFKEDIQSLVYERLHQINHFIAGCDSPFTYAQIAEVQEHLNAIEEILEIRSK